MSTVNELTFHLGGKQINLSKEDFNNAKKGFFDPTSAEGKAIKMAMTVDASADYATNAQEYFRKAMIGEERTRGQFRQLLGVKDRVKLGTADVESVVIKPGAATFDPNDTTILQKEFEVKPLMYGTVFDVRSLEESFVSDQLAKGSNNFNQQFAFMNFFFEQLSMNIEQQMEIITFKGTVAANGVDGLEVKLAADAAVLKPTAGNGGVASAVTDLNIVDKLKQARNVLRAANPAVLDKEDFVYIVSGNVYDALADAVSENKVQGLYYVEKEVLAFQGLQIYKARGASNDVIIATYWANLVNIQDLLDEELGFNIVDFMKTTLDRKIGVRVDFKFQPDYVIPAEIYFHKV